MLVVNIEVLIDSIAIVSLVVEITILDTKSVFISFSITSTNSPIYISIVFLIVISIGSIGIYSPYLTNIIILE